MADSAGQPWAGRRFEPNANAGDDGSAPPKLMAAITRFREGASDAAHVVRVVAESRLLIPLLAVLGESGVNAQGRTVDKSQELSIVTVKGPDGRTVLPVFSSVAAMTAWNPDARPVPASGPRVAVAAVSEGTELVVIDPTSDTEFALRRPALWAMSREVEWVPGYLDSEVIRAFGDSVLDESAVLEVTLSPGDPVARLHGPELMIHLLIADGLSKDQVAQL
ncbi:MAG: SseB family protein, partial [Terrimesophilobacter sp.]